MALKGSYAPCSAFKAILSVNAGQSKHQEAKLVLTVRNILESTEMFCALPD